MPGLEIVPALTCAICDQLIDLERQQIDTSEVVLFGAERYAWCVECGQQVPRPWTRLYKRQWIRAARANRGVPVGTVWQLRTAWHEGVRASTQGAGLSSCILPVGPERTAWVEGYLFASNSAAGWDQGFRRWVCSQKFS